MYSGVKTFGDAAEDAGERDLINSGSETAEDAGKGFD